MATLAVSTMPVLSLGAECSAAAQGQFCKQLPVCLGGCTSDVGSRSPRSCVKGSAQGGGHMLPLCIPFSAAMVPLQSRGCSALPYPGMGGWLCGFQIQGLR